MDSRASISAACWSTTSAQRRSSAARTAGLVSRQAGSAAAAASTAASMSAAVPRGTRVSRSPVAGLTTSMVSAEAAASHCPPTSIVFSSTSGEVRVRRSWSIVGLTGARG